MGTDGFLARMVKSTEEKTCVLWNSGASFTDSWHNTMQNNENRKEGSKRVTWDELVHVRTIEPCAGMGWGHHPDHKHSRQRKEHHWEESKQTNFYNSVTSPIL